MVRMKELSQQSCMVAASPNASPQACMIHLYKCIKSKGGRACHDVYLRGGTLITDMMIRWLCFGMTH